MKRNIILISFLFFIAFACNNDFLERYPKDQLSEQGFFNSANDLKLYANSFYPYLIKGHGYKNFGGGWENYPIVFGDQLSDNMAPIDYNIIAAGEHLVPATGGGWDWTVVRRANFFLTRYKKTSDVKELVNAYAGEVFAFRAWEYFNKVKRFGDVPWLSRDLETNAEELYAPRDPRKSVMDSVLNDINYAISLLTEKEKAGEGRLNREIVLALKARICLHEGTFRKYHELGDHEKYLREAADAAQILISEDKYKLYSTGDPTMDYRNMFITYDLSKNPEMILFKKYDGGLGVTNGLVWNLDQNYERTGLTKNLIDSYLCSDGLPPSQSGLFLGHDSIKGEILNRDPRLLQTVVFPGTELQRDIGKPAIPGTEYNYMYTPTGYQMLKFWPDDPEEARKNTGGEMDAPIIRFAEVLLIYAEAKAELGECTQTVIDQTINLLRARVGMPALIIANLSKDVKSEFPELDVLIDEIRRERRIELACEGFRYDDLMRWKKGKFLEKKVLGMKFIQKDYPEVTIGQDIFLDENGFIDAYQKQLPNGRKFIEPKHYYFPLPTDQLVLNPNLVQNPGW
jgi:starch-binding outer membrane protein, SusD/RagB family